MRERYPPQKGYAARQGVGVGVGDAPLPPRPTPEEPGTEGKLRVLAERAARHEALFHPDDARLPEGAVPWKVPLCHVLLGNNLTRLNATEDPNATSD